MYRLLIILILFLTACQELPVVTSKLPDKGLDRLGQIPDWYVILPAIGVQKCSVGMDESNFLHVFGGKRDGNYLISKPKGVEALIQHGRIQALFFHFYSNTYNTFMGVTDKDIGKDSSVKDVVTKYGKPYRISESVISRYGAMPGAHEKTLEYQQLGINFTFWDGRLADIRTYAKK